MINSTLYLLGRFAVSLLGPFLIHLHVLTLHHALSSTVACPLPSQSFLFHYYSLKLPRRGQPSASRTGRGAADRSTINTATAAGWQRGVGWVDLLSAPPHVPHSSRVSYCATGANYSAISRYIKQLEAVMQSPS